MGLWERLFGRGGAGEHHQTLALPPARPRSSMLQPLPPGEHEETDILLRNVAHAFERVIHANELDRFLIQQTRPNPSSRGGGEHKDAPINSVMIWNAQAVQSALQQHHLGMFCDSGYLIESMLCDAHIAYAVSSRTKAITGRDITISPPKRTKNPKRAKYVADLLTEVYDDIMPLETVEQIWQWSILEGWSLNNQIWDQVREGVLLPRLKFWHPAYTYFLNTAEPGERSYQAITLDSGTLPVREDDPEWALFAPYGYYRGWIRAAVRQVAIPWIVRTYCMRDWSRCSEVHGMPQRIAKVPANALEEDKARLFNKLIRLASEAAFVLPQAADGTGFQLELLEPNNTKSWEVFQTLKECCDAEIDLAIKGTRLIGQLGAKGTSSSLAASQEVREEDSDFAESDARKFASFIERCIFQPFCRYNEEADDVCPVASFDEAPPPDPAKEAQVWLDVSSACASFRQAGLSVKKEQVRANFGIDLDDAPPDPEPEWSSLGAPPRQLHARRTRMSARMTQYQDYIDDLAAKAAGNATAMRSHLNRVTMAIAASATPEELRSELKRIARDIDHGSLEVPLRNARLMAHMAGRDAEHSHE